MGANPTQARAIALFFVAATCAAAGIATDTNWLLIALGALIGGAAIALFLKCRPWEFEQES